MWARGKGTLGGVGVFVARRGVLSIASQYHSTLQYHQENEQAIRLHNRQKQKEYYLNNKMAIKEIQKDYYRKNKEAILDYHREYSVKNKELVRRRQSSYREKNKDHLKVKSQRRYRSNKDFFRAKNRLYRINNMEAVKESQRLYREKHRKPRKNKVWTDFKQVRIFLETARDHLHITQPTDWYRISRSQISEIGGATLYNVFGNLGKALEFAFPEIDWDQSKFSFRGKKSVQRWVRVLLEQMLPDKTDLLEDFLHPDLLWSDSPCQKMELDIWIPKYQLALEYQGEHHYHDFHTAYGPSGTLALYTERDLKKRNSCKERGITLVPIPYWWDGKKESLSSTLHQLLPDVFPKTDHPGIPPHPPKKESSLNHDHQVSTLLMHGTNWNTQDDPTGWFISEKLDGYRAFWDGQKLYTKSGNLFSVPNQFTQSFPRDVCLDGELWTDYANFSNLSSIYRKSNELDENQELESWQNVKFCVFDAPMHSGNYFERHQLATKVIVGCGPNICIIPIERCLSLDHLLTILNQVIAKKGEGVMLYHPTAKYTPGRTTNLLKVKAFQEEDVKFIKCNQHSYSFVCEQRNGVKCVVKCSGWDYMFPPPPGAVLTVKHNGFFTKSQKMKFPHLLRVRSDLEWDKIKMEH